MPRKPTGKEKRSVKLQIAVTPSEKRALEALAIRRSKPGALVSVSGLVQEAIQALLARG